MRLELVKTCLPQPPPPHPAVLQVLFYKSMWCIDLWYCLELLLSSIFSFDISCFCVLSLNRKHTKKTVRMALNVPGLIVMAGFYLVILGTGIWASMRSKKEEKKCTGDGMEITLLAGRNINLLVGIFTLTGTAVRGNHFDFYWCVYGIEYLNKCVGGGEMHEKDSEMMHFYCFCLDSYMGGWRLHPWHRWGNI